MSRESTPEWAPKRFCLIACEIAYRELCLATALSRNIVDFAFLSQGLHDVQSASMAARLQREVDAVDPKVYDAVLLAYGLCNYGTTGLTAPGVPLVIPRAHDCLTFFFGSKERYQEHFERRPGTFYLTTGWHERDDVNLEDLSDQSVMVQMGLDKPYQELVELYGEDNAQYLMEVFGRHLRLRDYTHRAYIQYP